MTSTLESSRFPLRLHVLAAMAMLAGPTGCSSMLNTTMLRDALVDAVDSPFDGGPLTGGTAAAASPAAGRADATARTQSSDPEARSEAGEDAEDAVDRRQQLAATLDTAIGRLSKVGGLDDAARAALLSTLENTSPDDWPAVIDAFTSSLAAAAPRVEPEPAADTRATPADAGVAMNAAPATPPADQPEPSEPEPERGGLVFPVEPVAATVAVSDSPVLPAEPAPQAMPDQLVVSNACFASRVRAWGVVDRFATDRFRPGQDVIVYFELDNLTASESSAGHTTIIDSSLKLVDAEGRLVHEWNFDPIDETCPARRRDYFARYLVRIPESVPTGSFRLELVVTDVLGGRTAQTAIPLAVGDLVAAADRMDGVQSRR